MKKLSLFVLLAFNSLLGISQKLDSVVRVMDKNGNLTEKRYYSCEKKSNEIKYSFLMLKEAIKPKLKWQL